MRVVRWTTTGRSTICTAERPESAARCCSHARCRHVSEHHLGVLPRAFTGMVVPHHGQVMVSGRCRCSRTLAPDEPASESCEAPAFRSVTVASPPRYGIRSNEYTHSVMHEVCPASRLWPHTAVVARCCGASSGRGRAEAAWASLFAVEDIEDVLVRLQAHGAELVGEASSKRTATGSATYAAPRASSSALGEQLG